MSVKAAFLPGRRASAFGLALAIGAMPFAADAQEAEANTETEERSEIVVLGTSNPIDRTLSSGPVTARMSQSSRSLEQDVLRAAGTYRLSDALELVSGFSQQNNRGGVLDNFAIRGFLGTPDGGAEYYVDGFVTNRGMAPPRDPATIERIEVLKGPAGAVFGDIDPGGRVNIVSKVPRFVPYAGVTATVGSFGTRRVEMDATGPLTDTLAARIVVAAEDSDGWRDTVTLQRRIVSPSLTWRPSDAVRLTYVGEVMRFDTPFDRGIPAVGDDANALPRSNYYGEPANGITRFRNDRHQLNGLAQLGQGWTVNGGVVWRTGSLKGFSADQSRIVGNSVWRQRRSRDFAVDDLAARIELAGQVGRHRLSIGLKGYRLRYGERWMRRNPTAAMPYAVDLYDPASSYGAVAAPLLPFTNNDERRWAVTLYVQDMWSVTDRLTLVGGARIDPYRQTIVNNTTGGVGRIVEEPVKFRAGARYAVDDHVSVHANWGESFLLNSGTGRTGEGFAPEEARGYEVGVAGRWDGLDVGITWFDIAKSNILTTDPVDAGFNAPVGRLDSRGIEADVSLRLARRWQVVANCSWLRARNDDTGFATTAVLGVPDHAGTLLVVHRLPVGAHIWQVSGGVAYVGDRAGSLDARPLVLPAYVKAKAAIEVPVTERLRVRLEADNLFDARYAASSYSRLWVFPGAPRTVRASVRVEL
ncbi:iron complex outermembrane receptor protein [Sphingomonas insulae]|uniref:TonB-dependent siderophore receptor n=1 Tax=Sphingomonas insulae TaxID=424800 RepID=A0ABP3T417_9SPHN|nr:TonB-dependent siderophore receptor [Sphingomonas insulae]NIJ30514.1 iron complex outermembrane receptor protein [Sphingomonas insulae]